MIDAMPPLPPDLLAAADAAVEALMYAAIAVGIGAEEEAAKPENQAHAFCHLVNGLSSWTQAIDQVTNEITAANRQPFAWMLFGTEMLSANAHSAILDFAESALSELADAVFGGGHVCLKLPTPLPSVQKLAAKWPAAASELSGADWPAPAALERQVLVEAATTAAHRQRWRRAKTGRKGQEPGGLDATHRAVLRAIPTRGHGLTAKELGARLRSKGVRLCDSTLRRHILPNLRAHHGVYNQRAAGGYLRRSV